jgi:hypothetical protein
LGEAYSLTNNEKYAIEYKNQILDWIRNNPVRYSPNWSCTMEVSIRVSNWIVSLLYFIDSITIDDEFLRIIMESIFEHGYHIRNNLENLQSFNSNHYIADISGLFLISIICPWLSDSNAWLRKSQRALECEIVNQTRNDGWNHESSTAYHRLVSEFFLYTYLIGSHLNHSFSSDYTSVLKKMVLVLYDIMKPDDTFPQIGDNDSGRFLVFNHDYGNDSLNVRYMVDTSVRLDLLNFEESANISAKSYSDSGRFLYKTDILYFLLSAGPKGQMGNGGHAHNDVFSFELNIKGRDIIVDPGTFCYTGDKKMRNSFRSIQNHNTLYWPDMEPCSLNNGLFHLAEEGKIKIISNLNIENVFSASYSYSGRSHIRRIFINKSNEEIIIEDSCSHPGSMIAINFAAEIIPFIKEQTIQINELKFTLTGFSSIEMIDSNVSPRYGILISAKKIVARLNGLKSIQKISIPKNQNNNRLS